MGAVQQRFNLLIKLMLPEQLIQKRIKEREKSPNFMLDYLQTGEKKKTLTEGTSVCANAYFLKCFIKMKLSQVNICVYHARYP